jgi:hypothetical protein
MCMILQGTSLEEEPHGLRTDVRHRLDGLEEVRVDKEEYNRDVSHGLDADIRCRTGTRGPPCSEKAWIKGGDNIYRRLPSGF